MNENRVDLMFGCLGNGIAVFDRSTMRGGDYRAVAHIEPCGAVKFYTDDLPADAVKQVMLQAVRQRDEFRAEFLRTPRVRLLARLYDTLSVSQLVELTRRDAPPLDTVEQIYDVYVSSLCAHYGYSMPDI